MESVISTPPRRRLSGPRTLARIVKNLPGKLYQHSTGAPVRRLMTSCIVLAVSYYLVVLTDGIFTLPFLWGILGLGLVGFSAIAQECAQDTFSENSVLNYIVGFVVSLPFLVPFESLRLSNQTQRFENMFQSLAKSRFWWLSSSFEWLRANFDLGSFCRPGNRRRMLLSVVGVWIFASIGFPLLVNTLGFWGLFKFWIAPSIAYLYWRSVFLQKTYQVPFTDKQIKVTIAFPEKYPEWVQFITNDIGAILSSARVVSHYGTKYIPTENLATSFNYIKSKIGRVISLAAIGRIKEERQQQQKLEATMNELREQIDFGSPVEKLPDMTLAEFKSTGRDRKLMLCDDLIFDMSKFYLDHPGGQRILNPFYGRDITNAFNGKVYNHSNGARNLARRFLVAKLAQE
eukprot:TRINITY_DN6982_c0_g1_i1.p1 TRINITY_DN6982_c0_g1~~TRINITY_DN6982_c0_g1_i1.p1  ORF type:complete len:421 (-),score=80.84 TRINITY_DN6982_c0_g1_i1:130-1332(-)